MANPFNAVLQNKIPQQAKPSILRRIQMNWWMNQRDEKKVIENLLLFMNKDLLPQVFYLAEAKQLIDYNVFEEPRDYLLEAARHYQESQQLGQIFFLLARCYHGLGLLDEALYYLKDALEYQPNASSYWNLQADCFLELGLWEDAVASLNKSLRSSPDDAETIYRLGSIYLFHGEYGEALNCFSGCCKLKPFNPDYWEMKAEMLIKLNQTMPACECYRRAIRYNGQIHLYSRLAYCYAQTGEIKKARKLLLKVLKNEPDNYDALCNLAGIYHKMNRPEQAYKLLKNAYAINCNDPLLLNNLGYICFTMGRSRKAIEHYHEALKINPADRIVLYNLGVCLYEKGLWEEARATLEKLVSEHRNNPEAWALLGNVYEQLSKHKIAVDCFNKSLGLA